MKKRKKMSGKTSDTYFGHSDSVLRGSTTVRYGSYTRYGIEPLPPPRKDQNQKKKK